MSTIGDNAAKLRISKAKYEHFLRILQKYSGYVKTIREASFEDKVEKRLLDKLSEGPTEKLRVNIEIPNLEDHSYATRIYQELETYMHARNLGDLEQTYLSDHFIIITAQVPAEAIQEIARNVDAIHRVSLASIIKLQGYGISREVNKKRTGMRLESLSVAPQFASINISAMPIVCVLDSGINRNHTFIQPYIVDTYDFMSGASLPCDDNVGHGTMVAGVAVYEGNVGTGQPISRVIAVKICDSMEFSGNIIELIRSAIRKFGNQSKVINLSFSTDYPDPALSKELDDLAFKEGVLFVVCTGNIQRSDMLSELNNGNTYPSYLSKYHIFFPGDCFNVLTVGSFAARASNLALDGHPSPFTRTNPFVTRIKPEVLASGGNMNVIQMNGKATDLTSSGCGVTSTTNSDNQLGEAAGTSFASPTTAGLVASVNDKWAGRPPCFYKAMVISSCRRLTDRGNQEFAASIRCVSRPARPADG